MSSCCYGTGYRLEGKWVAKDKEAAEFSGEHTSIEAGDASAPKVSFETMGESYYPQTFYSWHEDQLHWEIEDEIFTLHVLSGPGKLERPYQKYVTIENTKTESLKRYKLVEITEEEYEDTREWYKSVEDKIWCADSQWESLPTKDRIDNDDVTTLPADENGFIIKGISLYGYDENIGGPVVNVPEGIRRIKAWAFAKCKGITHVHIPDSVSSIGDGCFSECENIVSVRLPEGLAIIGDSMFSGCVNLREINLPDTVTSIGRDCFENCESLVEVVMPEALTILEDRAFFSATSLKRITLNSNLKKIDFNAFGHCTSLTEVYIPASVTTIDIWAFNGCSSIECIIVEDGNETYYSKGNCLIDRKNKSLVLAFNNSVIPDDGSVTKIGYRAFSNCKKVECFILPETIECIDSYAFSGCSALRNIQLPKSLPYGYGEGLFEYCSSLERFEIPSWMTEISFRMFMGCESLKEIKIPEYVTEIGTHAFSGCKLLTELVIPKSAICIGSFCGMARDNGNFIEGCSSLRRLEIENGNPVYHSRDNCIIETKTGTLFAILENGVIPNDGSVTKIGTAAFCACENITEISLPECITTIGSGAFSCLRNLKKINIPKNVNNIGTNAFFDGCDAVEEESGICYIGKWAIGMTRKNMEQIAPGDSTPEEMLPESGEITIREGTVGICGHAFSSSGIISVSLPNSLQYICNNAFVWCEKLQSVTIPHTVKSIGEDAFRFCKGLQNLAIPDVEIEIGRDAFASCGDIPNIDVPERILTLLTRSREVGGFYEDEGIFAEDEDCFDEDEGNFEEEVKDYKNELEAFDWDGDLPF